MPSLLLAGLLGVPACGSSNSSPLVSQFTEKEPAKASEPIGPPLFEDVTATSGVRFTYRNDEDTANHLSILESLGGGIALIDYDGDGLLDLFLPGGGGFFGADKREIVGHGAFVDVSSQACLITGGSDRSKGLGVLIVDVNGDQLPDHSQRAK